MTAITAAPSPSANGPNSRNKDLIPIDLFDLSATLNSGQVFHWSASGPRWIGAIGDIGVELEQTPAGLFVTRGRAKLARHYLALDHDLKSIYSTFPPDEQAVAALDLCRGIRILRQPKWECLATFITSSMKQVAHIRQMSLAMRTRYGKDLGGTHAFPHPDVLGNLTEADLRACGLGYRARNLLLTAQMVASGKVDLERIANLPTPELRTELCKLPGVGVKIANCVLLFAYERLDAVPIDVWIARILRETYLKKKRKVTPRLMEEFAARYFGPHAGYVQQYLFHRARTQK